MSLVRGINVDLLSSCHKFSSNVNGNMGSKQNEGTAQSRVLDAASHKSHGGCWSSLFISPKALANNLSQLAMTISVMEVSMMTWSLWETFAK